MKLRPVGAQLLHADSQSQTDMTKPVVTFVILQAPLIKHAYLINQEW